MMDYAEFRDKIIVLKNATGMHSSSTPVLNHPIYRELLEQGDSILSHVFYMMQFGGSHCLLLLAGDITGHCPISKEDYGRVDKLASSWIVWAKWYGYIPWISAEAENQLEHVNFFIPHMKQVDMYRFEGTCVFCRKPICSVSYSRYWPAVARCPHCNTLFEPVYVMDKDMMQEWAKYDRRLED